VNSLLSAGSGAPPQPRLPYFWSFQYGLRIQFAGHVEPEDQVSVEEGSVADGRFLAVYRRAGRPVAVLGVDQIRPFSRWRRLLEADPGGDVAAAGSGPSALTARSDP
jgi:hypothetical protein